MSVSESIRSEPEGPRMLPERPISVPEGPRSLPDGPRVYPRVKELNIGFLQVLYPMYSIVYLRIQGLNLRDP